MQTRRDLLKWSFGASVAAGLAAFATGCGQNVNTWASTVVEALTEALPIFQTYFPSGAGKVATALQIAKDLLDAIKNKKPNAIDFLLQLTAPDGLINKILDDIQLIPDVNERNIVSGLLILAGVALRLIAANLTPKPTTLKVSAEPFKKLLEDSRF